MKKFLLALALTGSLFNTAQSNETGDSRISTHEALGLTGIAVSSAAFVSLALASKFTGPKELPYIYCLALMASSTNFSLIKDFSEKGKGHLGFQATMLGTLLGGGIVAKTMSN